ncbi:hypothetical protein FGO68_gene4663 [Halteria grandinella]|uniref:Uncharacterized protein n=1 Tax=Halteria grandinella TaxID=5974 RepID=A0A8J8T0U7_HALGN|nr:hypothetical protein FGO68_gene4663 [Halteria grandinella]
MLCTHHIKVQSEDWIDYLFNESIVRGAAITYDDQGNKILVYPIRRTDLPGQPDEYAVISCKYTKIDGKVRWIGVYKPKAFGYVCFMDNIEYSEILPDPREANVVIIALSEEQFSENSKSDLKKKNLKAAFFNKQTHKGLNEMFIEVCKLLTTRNEQFKEKSNKNEKGRMLLDMLKNIKRSLSAMCLLFNTYAYFIMLRWINKDFTILPLMGLSIASIVCIFLQYFIVKMVIYLSMGCTSAYNSTQTRQDLAQFRLFIIFFLLISLAIIFDFVTLGLSIAHADGRALTHIIAFSVFATIPIVHYIWNVCSQLAKDKKRNKDSKQRILKRQKYTRPDKEFQNQQDDNLLIGQDGEVRLNEDETNISR